LEAEAFTESLVPYGNLSKLFSMIPKVVLLGFSNIDQQHQLIINLNPFGGTRGDICRSCEMRGLYVSRYLNSSEWQTNFCELFVKPAGNEQME